MHDHQDSEKYFGAHSFQEHRWCASSELHCVPLRPRHSITAWPDQDRYRADRAYPQPCASHRAPARLPQGEHTGAPCPQHTPTYATHKRPDRGAGPETSAPGEATQSCTTAGGFSNSPRHTGGCHTTSTTPPTGGPRTFWRPPHRRAKTFYFADE